MLDCCIVYRMGHAGEEMGGAGGGGAVSSIEVVDRSVKHEDIMISLY